MSSINVGMSVAVRALKELPAEQQAVYRARYVADETRERTCARLGIAPERYDDVLQQIWRSLRRMAAVSARSMAKA